MTRKNYDKWEGASAVVLFVRSGNRIRYSSFGHAVAALKWRVVLHRLKAIPRLIEEEIFG